MDQRASDAEREHVVQLLTQASGEGRITFEEFDERSTKALRAQTTADLHRLISDIPSTGLATNSQQKYRARWTTNKYPHLQTLEPYTRLTSTVGALKIDVRDAQVPIGAVIDVVLRFGSCEITIPDGCDVVINGSIALGSWNVKGSKTVTPGRGHITINVRGYGGSLTVRRASQLTDALRAAGKQLLTGALKASKNVRQIPPRRPPTAL